MSKENLEQFATQIADSEELRASIENQLDSDGNISADTLIALGAENGCEFTFEDIQETAELSDDELEEVAGGKITSVTVSTVYKLGITVDNGRVVGVRVGPIGIGWR